MAVFLQRIRSLRWWTTQPWKEYIYRETIGSETPPNPFKSAQDPHRTQQVQQRS